MQKPKLKILMVSEASFLSSGFSIYTKEILSRLYKTNKYEIAELACYGLVNDPRDKQIPWRYYANAVRDDDPRHSEYTSRADNQFGRWRFEKVLLDFRPDVVIDVRDYWMTAYQALSPLRKYFHWILMPTVDSAPQQEDWIDTFISADAIFTYSDWGAEVIKKQSSGKINYIDTVSPGVDLSVFKTRSKQEKDALKLDMGLPDNSIVFGSVMRNQKRKLIPELISSFRKALDILENDNYELGSNIYLYLHTSYPDAGWDIPELLKEYRLANKVFFTYSCKKCGNIKANVFSGPITPCSRCMEKAMGFSSVTNGISVDQLSKVYGLFDAYVQYSICEGFGCPQTEAGASGVPILTVDYSAMCDIIKKLEAVPIKPSSYFKELETKAIRVYPDNNQLADEIIRIAKMSSDERNALGLKTRSLTEKYYNWDDIAKKWENYLDMVDSQYRSNWNTQPSSLSLVPKNKYNPEPHQNIDAIAEICNNYIQNTDLISSMTMMDFIQNSDYGFSMHGMNIQKHSFSDVVEFANTMINNINQSEIARSNNTSFQDDFIQYAHIKANTINEIVL